MSKYLNRIEELVTKEKLKALKKKKVLVCGVGGVGSFVAESLARSGVGHITLCDFDTVDETNLNRQLMTSKSNIGESKVEVLKKRLENVSDAKIDTLEEYIDETFKLKNYDYIVDCIDSLNSKFELVKKAHEKNIPIISSLGTAKRLTCKNIKRTTLDKTKNDPLAKAFRSLVKKNKYRKKINVVYIDEPAIQIQKLGSSIFTVGSVGLFIGSEVYNDLLKEIDKINNGGK